MSELFAPGKQWQWSFVGSQEAVAVFHVGGIPYQFYAYRPNENFAGWDVEFKNAERSKDRTSKFGLTGTGNSAEVMSTVTDIMRGFLTKYQGKISELTFTADEPSRRALYARIVRRLLPTWELQQDGKSFKLLAPKTVTEEHAAPQSAGCVIVAEDTGRWCLQQRSDTVTDPGVWSTWGGGSEPGETVTETVLRELAEESGYTGPVTLHLVDSSPSYATFMARVPHEFEPRINSESQDWQWCEPDQLPHPLHPGLTQTLSENFADGKKKGRKGMSKRVGIPKKASLSQLQKIASSSTGERRRMAQWQLNMRRGKAKKNK